MVTQTKQPKTKQSHGISRKSSATRRKANVRGMKGGISSVQSETQKIQKEIPEMIQKYGDKTLKVAHKMGLKGGVAVLAGSAAGIVMGAALGTVAGAAMNSMKTQKLAHHTRSAAESIRKHADDIEKFTGKRDHDK